MKNVKIIAYTACCIILGILFGYLHLGSEGCFTVFHSTYSAFLYFIGFITISIGIIWTFKKIKNNTYKLSFLPTILILMLIFLWIFVKLYSYDNLKREPLFYAYLENCNENTFFTLRLDKDNQFEFRDKSDPNYDMICVFKGQYYSNQDTLVFSYNLKDKTYDTYFDKYLIKSSYLYPIQNGDILDSPKRKMRIKKNGLKK